MPIDTSIYQTPPPQGFNSPFQALGQIGALQRQQQEIKTSRAEEELHQQKLAEEQRQQQSAATFNAIIGNADLTPDAVRAQIQAKAPEHLAAFDASVAKIQEAADKHNESLAHYNEAMTKAQETTQNVISATANEIAAHDYNPLAFEVGLKTVEARIPAFKAQADLMRQEALKNGPDWIKQQVQGWQKQSDLETAAKIPGAAARSAQDQLLLAGTSPTGMTANQQAEAVARQAQLNQVGAHYAVEEKQGAQRLGLEGQRLTFDKTKEANANAVGDVSQEVTTTASGRKYLDLSQYQTPKAKEAARAAAQKAGIFPVNKDVADGLRAADTARMNVNAMLSQIQAKLPTDPTGRVLAAPGTALSKFFQTDEQKAAFDSWRSTAVQAIQSLSEKGMGLRLNQAEINLFLQNSLPRLNDTVGTAKQRVDNFMTQLDNKEKNALTQDRSAVVSTPGQADLVWDPATKTFKKP